MKRTLRALLFFVLALVAWEALFRAKIWSPVLVPSPFSVIRYLGEAAIDGTLWGATLVTLRRLLLGYVFGIALGLPVGLLTARFRVLGDTVGLVALGLQTLPSVCWVPLALLWFGQSEAAMFFVVVMGTLWSMTGPRRWLTLGLFFMSIGATGWLFASHATDALYLNF